MGSEMCIRDRSKAQTFFGNTPARLFATRRRSLWWGPAASVVRSRSFPGGACRFSNPLGCVGLDPHRSTRTDCLHPQSRNPSRSGRKQGQGGYPQKELSPILLQLPAGEDFSLDAFLLQHLRQRDDAEDIDKILAHELMLYDTQAAAMVGLQQQFIASARLDNLLSCFLAIKALLASDDSHASVLVCNDHEEVGSVSSAGARAPFCKRCWSA